MAMASIANVLTIRPDSGWHTLHVKHFHANPALSQLAVALSSSSWPFTSQLVCAITVILIVLALCTCAALVFGDTERSHDQESKPLMSSLGKPGYSAAEDMPLPLSQSSPKKQLLVPSAPIQPQVGAAPTTVTAASPRITSTSPQLPRHMPPQQTLQSMPGASGLLASIWSSPSRSLPPPLCNTHPPSQGQSAFKIPKSSFRVLAAGGIIEVLGGFDYPLAYARLGSGPEGGRLEMVTEPSWRNIVGTVGPLDWPGVLGQAAAIHGPNRELYGSFGRTHTGFAVGHFSQAGSVLTLTPKRLAGGIYIELTSATGQQIAAIDRKSVV